AIAVYSTEIETYSSQHIQLMEKVSQAASDAVYNAIAFEQAQKAANTDTVTGLVNTRGLAAHFEREKARCRSNKAPRSLLLIARNESAAGVRSSEFGVRSAGEVADEIAVSDQTLAAVGQIIKEQINGREIAARYWNHSFIVLLPDVGNKEAANKRSNLQI